MTRYAIFDLNGCVAWYGDATSEQAALEALQKEDDSYCHNPPRVHELDIDECIMLDRWIEGGQASHEWPFDWRGEL